MRVAAALWWLAVAAGCGRAVDEARSDEWASRRGAIVGGEVDTGDPQVFMLVARLGTGRELSCSATLLGARTLLTAAHCVDQRSLGEGALELWAHDRARRDEVGGADRWGVVETRLHPHYAPPPALEHDVALLLLDRAVPLPPRAWNRSSLQPLAGAVLRAVGYGAAESNLGAGVRRQVSLAMRVVTPTRVLLGDLWGRGICHGDSGGPSFHTFPDGVERLVGVHSYTQSGDCLDGADSRIDTEADFVRAWLREKEGPRCDDDGLCRPGCEPHDADCDCVADGLCGPSCGNLLDDPDCPRECAPDGVCATATCPRPDADCRADGEGCSGPLACRGRVCRGDSQHAAPYCTRPCQSTAECAPGMECADGACRRALRPQAGPGEPCVPSWTFCTGDTACGGTDAAATRCVRPCHSSADCALPSTCEVGVGGVRVCAAAPPTATWAIEHGGAAHGPAAGCSASSALMPWGVILIGGATRRRKKR